MFSSDSARLRRGLWIYAKYQLAGLAMTGMSIASMFLGDRGFLTREPNLALLYFIALAVPAGALGAYKALRFFSATARSSDAAQASAG